MDKPSHPQVFRSWKVERLKQRQQQPKKTRTKVHDRTERRVPNPDRGSRYPLDTKIPRPPC